MNKRKILRIGRERTTHESSTWSNSFRFFSHEEYKRMRNGEIWLPNYSRCPHSNPDNVILEQELTQLEGASDTLTFDCGMSAITAVFLSMLDSGDSIILTVPCYSKTYRLAKTELPRFGITVKYLNLNKLGSAAFYGARFITALNDLVDERTKLILAEDPANPHTFKVPLRLLADFSNKNGYISAVDNTIASPYNQRPLEYGCDIALESLTKYFSDGEYLAGSVSWNENNLQRKFKRWNRLADRHFLEVIEPYYSPLAASLAEKCWRKLGKREKEVRIKNLNAFFLARLLEEMGFKTYYPMLTSHPQSELASQMKGGGCIVTFDIGDKAKADAFSEKLAKKIPLAVSLGSPVTMFQHPAEMTHNSIPEKERLEMGITDGLFRVSCGHEKTDWLLKTFKDALKPFRP